MSKPLPILFVGCVTHGDEQVGYKLACKYPQGKTEYWQYRPTICNKNALKLNQRYTDQDLNRSFPGIQGGNYEQNRAYEITQDLEKADFIIDIHQTTAINNSCLIINKLSKLNLKQIYYFDISNILVDIVDPQFDFVFSQQTNATGGKCLDSVFPTKSITLEYSKTDNELNDFLRLESDFINFTEKSRTFKTKKFFTIIGQISKSQNSNSDGLSNFTELTNDQKLSYGLEISQKIVPVFIGEKAYSEIFCFWAKEIYLDQIYQF